MTRSLEATMDAGLSATASRTQFYRWGQLMMGIVCMAMIANLQYGWTLFVNPIADRHGWSRAAIQVAFTIFVLTETWLVPIEGYLVDRFGPRPVVLAGGLLCGLAWFLTRAPEARKMELSAINVQQSKRDYSPAEVLRSPVFWVMYLMFVMVAAGGLMATAQLGPIAKDFKIGDVPVDIMGLVLPALTFALAIDRVLNGLTRPFFGWVSDQIGREPTMFIAFALEAVGILALYTFGQHPVAFVVLTGIVFFAWGEIYSLFPSTCADTFGSKYAASNAGMLYTAKGTASLLVPLSSVLAAATGSWHTVFIVASIMNAIAALLAWFVLRPMRRAHMS